MTPRKESVLHHCKCCSKEFYVSAYKAGCGLGKFCSRACNAKFNHTIHRQCDSRTYMSWEAMIQRCCNPKAADFPKWGGAGVTVSKDWRESFVTFLADLGERPTGKSLDRIDGKLGYCKENCRWATPREQNQNQKINRLLTFHGETKCLAEWARTVGLSHHTIEARLDLGWTVEEALTIPARRAKIKTIRKKRLLETLS